MLKISLLASEVKPYGSVVSLNRIMRCGKIRMFGPSVKIETIEDGSSAGLLVPEKTLQKLNGTDIGCCCPQHGRLFREDQICG